MIKVTWIQLPFHKLLLAAILLAAGSIHAKSANSAAIFINGKQTKIVFSDREPEPLKVALEALKRDFEAVLGDAPRVTSQMDDERAILEIVIVNRDTGRTAIPTGKNKELDGFESHRVHADAENNRIYLEGFDLRGTIYAIYTFGEEVLGVPPLYQWCSWKPEKREHIKIPGDTDIYYKSPQVRYRSILPGDQDFFMPWKRESEENNRIWRETSLRLKLNTVEAYSTIEPGYKLTDYAYQIDEYGLVLTSHHIAALNTSFSTWKQYWEEQRKMVAPRYLLSNQEAIMEFFRYNAETVHRSGIENLWTIAFRGERDQPFWSIFEDAPEDDRERAEVINRMLQIQYDLIREVTGEDKPYVRITFYDELASLMAKGYLRPPEGDNMIWTFVAARRDHYPYEDLVNFNPRKPVKLGYYMNFGFASTGAHVAPAEGPWKMEFNYRYVNSKSPLYFSVVNVGNMREFLMELSANAKLLWDYESYDTDAFLLDYCRLYFGGQQASGIVQLYKDFYNAYWLPKAPEFENLQRQFIFQDLRYARAFDHIYDEFFPASGEINMNPLHKIGYESVPGRTFRIDLDHNNSTNQVEALLNGMQACIPKFERVAAGCSEMMGKLDPDKRTFFNDNLRIHAYYMAHLSKALYHYVSAYKFQHDKRMLVRHLELARDEAIRAQAYLNEAQHGKFSTWYSNADPLSRTFQIDALIERLAGLKEKALEQEPNTLTRQEVEAGWKLLWDGKSSKGWRAIYLEHFPASGWIIENGQLICLGDELPEEERGGAIITNEKYGSFELSFEFKIREHANSGIKYFLDERLKASMGHGLGLEFAILDDENFPYPDKDAKRTCGSLYDLVKAEPGATRPVGEWNHGRIVIAGNHIEHWLNGKRVVDIEKGTPHYYELVSKSKYRNIKGWGEFPEGHILLQDEGPRTAFRNIKIRRLDGNGR